MCLRLQEGRFAGAVRLWPEDLGVASAQLPVAVAGLLLVAGSLVLYQQKAIKNKNDGETVVEQEYIVMGRFQPVVIVLPDGADEEVAGHGQGKRNDGIINIPQKEYGQHPIQDEKEFDTGVYSQGIDQAGDDGVKSKIEDPCQFIPMIVIGDEDDQTDQ